MENFLKYKIYLVFTIIWAVLTILSLITKEYHDALLQFLIANCCLQVYFLKQQLNPSLKSSMNKIAKRTQRAIKKSGMTKGQIDQMVEDIRSGKIVEESEEN